jgi:alpha-glucosidase (family GH31 glycosyl hydrolase)
MVLFDRTNLRFSIGRGLLLGCLVLAQAGAVEAQDGSNGSPRVTETADQLLASMPNYALRVQKRGFRFQLERPDGRPFAAAHPRSGLQLAENGWTPGDAVSTTLHRTTGRILELRARTDSGIDATVEVEFFDHHVRFAVRPEREGSYGIVLRTAGMSPAFGLGDHVAYPSMHPDERFDIPRHSTDVTGYVNEAMYVGNVRGFEPRLVSNFVIFPRHEVAVVNVEPGTKIVRVTEEENAQGSASAREVPALFYFMGEPKTIYRSFLEARNASGYRVYRPKYEWFGVGWEAWGALAWDTNQQTVTENVDRYLELGFPLRWMVVGSGFWPRPDSSYHATTSFGMWDAHLYPDPRGLINHFHRQGLKFIVGLRISFITDGPFADEGVRNGYFLQENGKAKVFTIAFPRRPVYLLDAHNPQAVDWYIGLTRKWLDFGVDGFKEDLFGYSNYRFRDDKIDPVNAALMELGVYVMGRNGYLGSPMDLHRYNDFNFNQTQDRGPINGLVYGYSGFPYVYPDIVGGTFAEDVRRIPELRDGRLQRYYMRYAQYAAVNPSMSMGFGPWNFPGERVTRVALEAALLHDRLHPYIYSAAIDSYRTGFPYTLTPLPLAYPEDPNVYGLENTTRRSYQWLIGESLLATPLYGDDYATAETRDVYLPAGTWIDYDTGAVYEGPRTLEGFPLPIGKTPLFVGGKGIVVEQRDGRLEAHVYPVRTNTSITFHHHDGGESTIVVDLDAWAGGAVVRSGTGEAVAATRRGQALVFPIRSGMDYRVGAVR